MANLFRCPLHTVLAGLVLTAPACAATDSGHAVWMSHGVPFLAAPAAQPVAQRADTTAPHPWRLLFAIYPVDMRGNPAIPMLWRDDVATSLHIARGFRHGLPGLGALMAPDRAPAEPAARPSPGRRVAAALSRALGDLVDAGRNIPVPVVVAGMVLLAGGLGTFRAMARQRRARGRRSYRKRHGRVIPLRQRDTPLPRSPSPLAVPARTHRPHPPAPAPIVQPVVADADLALAARTLAEAILLQANLQGADPADPALLRDGDRRRRGRSRRWRHKRISYSVE